MRRLVKRSIRFCIGFTSNRQIEVISWTGRNDGMLSNCRVLFIIYIYVMAKRNFSIQSPKQQTSIIFASSIRQALQDYSIIPCPFEKQQSSISQLQQTLKRDYEYLQSQDALRTRFISSPQFVQAYRRLQQTKHMLDLSERGDDILAQIGQLLELYRSQMAKMAGFYIYQAEQQAKEGEQSKIEID